MDFAECVDHLLKCSSKLTPGSMSNILPKKKRRPMAVSVFIQVGRIPRPVVLRKLISRVKVWVTTNKTESPSGTSWCIPCWLWKVLQDIGVSVYECPRGKVAWIEAIHSVFDCTNCSPIRCLFINHNSYADISFFFKQIRKIQQRNLSFVLASIHSTALLTKTNS
jgi:hypothetical protein